LSDFRKSACLLAYFEGKSVFGAEMATGRFLARNGSGREINMQKLTGVEIRVTPEEKAREFIFSTDEIMRLRTGQRSKKEVEKIIGRLVNHVLYIAKNSNNKNVILPADLKDQVGKQVDALNSKGYELRFYVRFGADVISEQRLRELADPEWVYDPLWVPDRNTESYKVEELNGSETGISVMGAFMNAEESDFDATLFLLNHPFDDEYSNGKISQENGAKEFLAESIDGLETSSTDHRDADSMYIMDRNDQMPPSSVIFAQGLMRIPLGRRSVDGDSVVGGVFSDGGRWGLSGSNGFAYDCGGVSFSAGLADA